METAALSVRRLTKSFGRKQALHHVSFDCQPGHIVGLIGANGAGKTTIMKAILSLIKAKGDITINGQVSTFRHHAALADVGALIEYPGIYPYLSGRNQMKLFATPTADKNQRIQTIIQELHMAPYIDRRVKGYSLGMRQKMGIALALVNNPSLVILDEPMNGLDPQATKELRELIQKKQASGTTFLISSHILSELQKLAEDLIVIDHGRVVQQTTMRELLARNQHFLSLTTDQDLRAAGILAENGYLVTAHAPVRVQLRSTDTVAAVLKILTTYGVSIEDVQHEDGDFEQSVLDLIRE
ncbi:ATP-binding cassette domain-containing protein [Levilactobacillus acidifarinae]|uniref:ABC superfamily ATP binding cassette transporter, ABC protein n=1 Tax=Levilactobacillus acidifarinae DSM 19394 = JCM 15949 TaxID=1423715 RepID=A0A0R1LPG1_9LACO|nr:ATP-binding cassette domain-containing protein [Levilactobacillus acidifarinae]KRK93906.1 ABC superfamily ATP binding cassette transporter, ABC protein [Levilactobacillus acidifarinae DSM 19394]GEO68794.1 ABC transporter ATP-binding protein [Levilactobacillus acidifarinae]